MKDQKKLEILEQVNKDLQKLFKERSEAGASWKELKRISRCGMKIEQLIRVFKEGSK